MDSAAYTTPKAMADALRSGTYMTPLRDRPRETAARRTFAPAYRRSLLRGGPWETAWTGKMAEAEADGIRNAIRTLLHRLREDGAKDGRRKPLARIAIELVRMMGWFFKRTGRFEMSIDEMAERLGCSASAVHKNLKRLRDELKCLVWQQRCVPSGLIGQRGPQYTQTSNIYRLVPLPPRVMALIHGMRPTTPKPEDEEVRLADQLAERLRLDKQESAIALREAEKRSPAVSAAMTKIRREQAARAAQQGPGEVVEWEDWMEFADFPAPEPDPHRRA